MKEPRTQTGIVFGVFDGLHPGHQYLLTEAQKLCQKLIVVLTLPQTVQILKSKTPKNSYAARAKALKNFNPNLHIFPADKTPGQWSIFKNPDFNPSNFLVILGYDQKEIAGELKIMEINFIFLKGHKTTKYKSSLLSAK